MTRIEELLEAILEAVYGVDVRQSIHDAIQQCYYDSKVGSLDLIARQQIATLVAANNETDGNSELIDIRTGADAKTYESAGEAVRQQFTALVAKLQECQNELENIRIGADETPYDSAGEAVRVQISEIIEQLEQIAADDTKDFTSIEFDNDERFLHFYDEFGVDVYEPVYISGGSGPDNGTDTVTRLTNQNGVSVLTYSYGSAVTLMFTFTSIEYDIPTGNGSCKITVNGVPKVNMNIPQGLTAIDVAPYLNIGSNTVVVTCTDVYGKSRSISYTVTIVKLNIESTFDATVPYTDSIIFKYTPYGAVEKTIHFVIDGTEIGTVVTSLSGKQITRTLPKMSHGAHKLEVYSTATLNETSIESSKLVYDIVCLEDENTTPIIASVYGKETVSQGEQVSIPYIVYDPSKLACDISLTIYTLKDGNEVVYNTQDITVDRSQWTWNTRKYPVGDVYFRIKYGDMHKTHKVVVGESKIHVEPETNDMELYLSSEGRSNNEVDPDNWAYGDITTTFSGVNWSSAGWVDDEFGDACLRLNGDATAEIEFKPFAEDLRVQGKTIELDFTIKDVNNKDSVVISCMSGGIGFEVKADTAYIVSEQSRVFCNYKDEERVKLAFVIESKSEYRLMSIYLNGVLSDTIQYPTTDNFQQSDPVNITIGSPDCGIDVYRIRSYTTALADNVLINNYIADINDLVKKTEAFEDNDIYDEYGNISFLKAKAKNSTMVIVGDLPQAEDEEKNVAVQYYDVENSKLNFVDEDVTISIQGTSSLWYVRKNWKLKCSSEHHIDADQLPASVICIKVDYAEATGTHNTQNANFVHKLYSEPVPAQAVNSKVRTTIYGKPILLFYQESATSDPVFYGKANFNYDKGAESVFGFTSDYDVECWEFRNNTSDDCNFLGPISTNWSENFKARYPDKYKNISRFKVLHDWVVSTKGNVEKFKNEFETYFDLHYSLIYYVYTFFALMVDQRAKNMFLTYWGNTGKWYPYFYDNDTCFGINNEGQLVFDYYHEDTDQLEGANVYNGQNSTLWCNFREAFADEIKETYQNLRSNGVLNYDELIEQFIINGSDKWSESIYNEDGDFKYISMLRSNNDATNLPQVRGTGEEHFRYFIENRLNYCDSKWYASDYADDYISLRIYTPESYVGTVVPNADITITPYSDFYAGVRYKANGTLYQERVKANTPITFNAPDETFNDTETAIYNASRISSLGDLSPLYCGSIDVSKATKLTELKIGESETTYSNPNLKELSVGTNKLLRTIDISNCPNLTGSVDLSGCPNIEEVYAAGTSITGVEFIESGCLSRAHLPATITNLTLKDQAHISQIIVDGYDSLKTLWVENCPTFDSLNVIRDANNIERVRLTKVDWSLATASTLIGLIDRNIAGIDENGINTDTIWIDGTCRISRLTGAELNRIKAAFPYLTISYTMLISDLIFKTWDGSTELARQSITNAGNGADPVVTGTVTDTSRETTDQYTFAYAGWSTSIDADANDPNALKNVEGDRTVYMAFTKTLRYYDVKFYNGTTLIETINTPYGGAAYYSGEEPEKTGVLNPEDYEFKGWSPSPANITGETTCFAQYEFIGSWARELAMRIIHDHYENDRVNEVGYYAFRNCTYLKSVSFPEVTDIHDSAFEGCVNLTSINFPKAERVRGNAFYKCGSLESVCLPAAINIGVGGLYAFSTCQKLTRVDLSVVQTIYNASFNGCIELETFIIRNEAGVCKMVNANALGNTPIDRGTGYIYVPRALVDSYKAANSWSTYADQIRAIEDYPDICGGDA